MLALKKQWIRVKGAVCKQFIEEDLIFDCYYQDPIYIKSDSSLYIKKYDDIISIFEGGKTEWVRIKPKSLFLLIRVSVKDQTIWIFFYEDLIYEWKLTEKATYLQIKQSDILYAYYNEETYE